MESVFRLTFAETSTDVILRQCTALFLLVAMLASSFSKAVIVVDFYANRDYIAKNLCVNRDKPMMRCGGRCQLCKRLEHEEKQDNSNPERRVELRSEVVFFEELSNLIAAPAGSALSSIYPVIHGKAPVDRADTFFHPPSC